MKQTVQTTVTSKTLTSKTVISETKEQLIKRLIAKAELDFKCCGQGGKCNASK